jgi:AcrR family transcriptional regulator
MTRKVIKEKRINDILDAAVSEFIEKGYEATSMDSIAARAGLTKGGLYYHFESKDDILVKANERFMEPVLEIMADAVKKAGAAEGLTAYVTRYIRYWTGHPREMSFIFLTMAKSVSEERFARCYHGYTGQIVGFLDGLYRQGIASGEFNEMNSQSVSIALMAALDGIIGYIVLDDTLDPGSTIDAFIATFVTAHTRRGSHE